MHSFTFLYIWFFFISFINNLVRTCCDNQVHVKRVDLHSQLCHFLKVCLNLWLENVGLVIWTWLETFVKATSITQTLLHFSSIDNDIKTDFTVWCSPSQHLTSASCSSFFSVFLSMVWAMVWSVCCVCQGQHPRNEKPKSQWCEFQKNCILATYNISPRQAVKEENRKKYDFLTLKKITSLSYL